VPGPHTLPTTGFALRGDRRTGIVRLYVSGTLDTSTAPILEREILAVVGPGGALILDLEDVIGIDRSGSSLLLRTGERADRDAWRLSIVHFNDAVRKAFEGAGGDRFLCATDALQLLDAGDHEWSPIALPAFLGQRIKRRASSSILTEVHSGHGPPALSSVGSPAGHGSSERG
jgi:anti-anti-sigma factor